MIYDYKHRKIEYESPMEKAEYEQHMSQFGPGMGKSHPDDCPRCKAKGWLTFPGTTFEKDHLPISHMDVTACVLPQLL